MNNKVPRERNPYVSHIKLKVNAGAHGKSKKATRRKEKVLLKKKSFKSSELVW